MSILPLGTTKSIFGNTFVYVDPQYIDGLGLWRVYPGIPESSDLTGIGGVLPITVQDTGAASIKVSFNIAGLSSVSSARSNKSFLSAANTLLQQPASSLAGIAPASQNIQTIAPVQNLRAQSKAVLYFDISSLSPAEIVGHGAGYVDTSAKKYRVAVKDYNNSNGVNIDSEAPMVDEVIGNTATFSFDITTLPKV